MNTEGYIEWTEDQFYAPPARVQEALRVYGRQPFPVVRGRFRIPISRDRLKEIEDMLVEEKP